MKHDLKPVLRRALLLAALGGLAAAALPLRAQETRRTVQGDFDRIEVSGTARVELTQGAADQAEVPGEDPSVRVEVEGRTLQVHTGDSWKFWSREQTLVKVQVRKLSRISISGASDIRATGPLQVDQLVVEISGQGSVRLDDVRAQVLRFDISGAGDGELAGQAGELRLSVSGKGKLVADRLRAARASVSISGIGNADVWATDDLRIAVSGVGTVNYWGQPALKRSSSGVAVVNARGDKR